MSAMVRGRVDRRTGEMSHRTHLTERDVREIRRLYDMGDMDQRQIASRFAVSQPNVSFIVRRMTWKHVPEEVA